MALLALEGPKGEGERELAAQQRRLAEAELELRAVAGDAQLRWAAALMQAAAGRVLRGVRAAEHCARARAAGLSVAVRVARAMGLAERAARQARLRLDAMAAAELRKRDVKAEEEHRAGESRLACRAAEAALRERPACCDLAEAVLDRALLQLDAQLLAAAEVEEAELRRLEREALCLANSALA